MKQFKVMAAMFGVALCLGFTACSDDDGNESNNGGGDTTMVVNPEKVFTGGIPKSAAGMTISQNEEGLVTSITTEEGDKAVFEYFSATTKADVVIDQARITVTDSYGDVTELNLHLNKDGYVELTPAETPDFAWMAFTAPMVAGTDLEGNGTPRPIKLCDFASAGNTWDKAERYRVWLPKTLNVTLAPYKPYNE